MPTVFTDECRMVNGYSIVVWVSWFNPINIPGIWLLSIVVTTELRALNSNDSVETGHDYAILNFSSGGCFGLCSHLKTK